jgi:alpha-tubulin suppressor-like RCC1 family protein
MSFLLLATTAMVASDANASTIIRWGNNGAYGSEFPVGLTNAVRLVSSAQHTLALKADGTVVGWGWPIPDEALALASVTDAKAITVARHHGMLLRSNSTVVAWGEGNFGENTVPSGLSNIVAIAAGARHNLAVKSDGTVVAWGANDIGQAAVPPGLSNVVAVDASGDFDNDGQFSVALKSDGTVVAWGYNFFGTTNVPVGLDNVVAISAGSYHVLALKADGTVVGWGNNEYGLSTVPAGLSNVISICAGPWFNVALKNDGMLVAWGGDSARHVPPGLSNVVAVTCGIAFGLALVETAPPVIMQYSPGQFVYASNEDGFQLRVTAQGPAPLTYQWYKDGTPLAAETNDILWVAPVQAPEAGSYTVTVSNPFGSVTSDPAVIEVRPILLITLHPQSQTVAAGQNVTLLSHAKGWDPIHYQWQKNGINITGATNETLTLNSVQTFDSGRYRVAITNIYTNYYTAQATLLVVNPTGPNISSHPEAGAVFPGARFAFTVAATATNGPLSYQWRKDGAELAGQTGLQLNFSSVQMLDAGNYDVVVSAGGISATSAVASLTATPHSFTFATTGSVVSLGGPAVPDGLNDIVSIAAGARHGVALRSDGTVVQWTDSYGPGSVPSVPAGLSNVVAIAAADNQALALRSDGTLVGWGGVAPPTNLFGNIGIAVGRAHGLAIQADGTVRQWNIIGGAVPPGLGNVTAVAAGSFWSAALQADGTAILWGGLRPGLPSYSDLTAIAGGDAHIMGLRNDGTVLDHFSGSDPANSAPLGLSNVTAIAASSQSLALLADGSVVGWNGASLPPNLNHIEAIAAGEGFALVLTRWPVITQHPKSLTVNEGANVSFNMSVAGAGPIGIQWQKDGANISGAMDTNFSISTSAPTDVGNYRVIVSNSAGSVTSVVATLDINTFPVVIEQPTSENIFVGARVVLGANALGALPLTYQWRRDNVNLVGETNVTLSISQAQSSDAGFYTLVANNSYGSVTSAVATLTVIAHTFSWPAPGTVVSLDGPMVPLGLNNAVAVAAGSSHSVALRNDGTVVEWPIDLSVPFATPRLPAGLSNVIAISLSQDGFGALALHSDGTVVAGYTAPPPADLFGVVAIAAGAYNNLALKVDGTIVSWGPLGVSAGLSNVVAIAAGSYNVALKSDGSAAIWRFNLPANPFLFADADDLIAIAAGGRAPAGHTMALRSNGTVVDYFGGSTPINAAPADLSDVVAIAAGENHSLALKSDGTIVRWNTAPAPEGISNVTVIAAGGGHSLLITATPPAPMLAAALENGQFALSTPISVSGYTLETVTNLSQVTPPTGVSTQIITFERAGTAAAQNNAAKAANGTDMKFFRLRKTN